MPDKVPFSFDMSDLRDPEVFGKVYELYSKRVYRFAYSYTSDTELSRDIVQDVFASFWERRHTLELNGPFENYLVRAVKLKIFKTIRSQKVRDRYKGSWESISAAKTEENEVFFNQLNENFEKLVETLPDRGKEIYKLSFEQNQKNKAISARLLISEKTVEYHLTRSIKILKQFLLS